MYVPGAVDNGGLVDGENRHGDESEAAIVDESHQRKMKLFNLAIEVRNEAAQLRRDMREIGKGKSKGSGPRCRRPSQRHNRSRRVRYRQLQT